VLSSILPFLNFLLAGFAFFVRCYFAALFAEFIGFHFIFFLFAFCEIIVLTLAIIAGKD